MRKLFSERHGRTKARVAEVLDEVTRTALISLLAAKIDEHWFGRAFPDPCLDGFGFAGTDIKKLRAAMDGYGVIWPHEVEAENPPDDALVFDLLEFGWEVVAEAQPLSFHSYMGHHHFGYDQAAGRTKLTEEVNRLFEKNGIAFELQDGEVSRLTATPFHEALESTTLDTGDGPLDELLETARYKLQNRSLKVRRESLEKLWDAWERLKTLKTGKNKKATTKAMLDAIANGGSFRDELELEATTLTRIGNTFMIRHTERDKTPVTDSDEVDYFFMRMFSLIRLALKKGL